MVTVARRKRTPESLATMRAAMRMRREMETPDEKAARMRRAMAAAAYRRRTPESLATMRAAMRMRREMETPDEKAARMRRAMAAAAYRRRTPESLATMRAAMRMRREMETPDEKAERMKRAMTATSYRRRKRLGLPTARKPAMTPSMKAKKARLRYFQKKHFAPYLTFSALSRDYPKRQRAPPRLRTQFKRPKGASVNSMGRMSRADELENLFGGLKL